MHLPTGLRHIHLSTEDDNNVFLALFRTPASNNTGVSHVLEHMVLCGGEHFPVHDAFFAMTNRSLNTGMNAFATPDCSGFHFSTRYPVDFDNLLKVYLDGLFFPLLDPLTFAREGIRIDIDDNDKPFFNGVVFNEMKGALGDVNEQVKMFVRAQLFPASRYSYNEGGDPLSMTGLKIEQLSEFHQQHYCPANTIFITYGNQSAHEHQRKFAINVLENISLEENEKILLVEPPKPNQINIDDINATDQVKSNQFVIAWRLGRSFDSTNQLCAQLLQQLLIETKNSLFQQTLRNYGITIIPGALSGWNNDCIDTTFSLHLSTEKPTEKIKHFDTVLKTLSEITPATFSQQVIDDALDNIELEIMNLDSATESSGLNLIRRIIPALLYETDAAQSLKISDHLLQLREQYKSPKFIPELVQEYLLDNNICVCVDLESTRQIQANEPTTPDNRLTEIWNRITGAENSQLKQTSSLLQQQTDSNYESLPLLDLDQIQIKSKPPNLEYLAIGANSHYYSCPALTGVDHLSIAFDLRGLTTELREFLPVYLAWIEINAKKHFVPSKVEFALKVFSPSHQIVLASGKCLGNHTELLLQQATDLIINPDPTTVDPRTLIEHALQRLNSNLHKQGHEFAMRLAASTLDPAAYFDDQCNGVAAIANLTRWKDDECGASNYLQKSLTNISEHLTQSSASLLHVGDNSQFERFRERVELFPTTIFKNNLSIKQRINGTNKSAWLFASDVNYCAQVMHCKRPKNPQESASLYLLAAILEIGYLRQAVRHQGGAYGAGARYDLASNTIKLFSYRDPRLLDTINDFNNAWLWFEDDDTEQYLQQAKLTDVAAKERLEINHSGFAQHQFFDAIQKISSEFYYQAKQAIVELEFDKIKKNISRLAQPEYKAVAVLTDHSNEKLLRESGYKIENAERT